MPWRRVVFRRMAPRRFPVTPGEEAVGASQGARKAERLRLEAQGSRGPAAAPVPAGRRTVARNRNALRVARWHGPEELG